MKYVWLLLAVPTVPNVPNVPTGVAGVAGIVFGEADDSPGLQLIGGLLVIGVIGMGVRTLRRVR